MITGSIKHVVVQADDEDNIIAVWGPFPSEDEAVKGQGIPGREGSYRTHAMHSAPQWFEEISIDEENS